MCKHRSVGIISELIAVFVCPGLGKNLTVSRIYSSSGDIPVLYLFPVIVAVIIEFDRRSGYKYRQIYDHEEKETAENKHGHIDENHGLISG